MPLKAENLKVAPVWSILSKGRTGTGKTLFSCGKEFRPVYVFNCEGRMESVISYYNKLDGHCKDVDYDNFTMGTTFYALDKQMDILVARPEYKTVVMSSLTSYIHLVLKHTMAAKVGQVRKSGAQAGKRIAGIQVNELEDYMAEDAAIIFELLAFMQEMKSNGVNVILEAHISPYDITTINEDTKGRDTQTYFQILTKGRKAPAQIPGYFNEVWLFEKKFDWDKPKYNVNTVGSQTDECKTSFGIESFEWTGIDGSVELMKQLSGEIKDNPRVDPNKPKAIAF